jgi:beta-lactamase regulating signal transducer with metallopeptidase domain
MTLFDRVLEASWQAGVIVMLVLAISLIAGRWIAPRWRCALWSLVFVRLMLPALPASHVSLFRFDARPILPVDVETTTTTMGVIAPGTTPSVAKPRASVSPAKSPTNWLALLAIAWAVVAGILITRHLLALWMLSHWIHTLPPLEDARLRSTVLRIVESDRIASPALAGIVRPVLVLPRGLIRRLSDDELAAILRHETAHLKRHDVLIGLLASLACCVHWFNPLIWLAEARFRAERELACDAIALAGTGDRNGVAYGRTLLKLLDEFPPPRHPATGSIGLLGSRRAVRRRIEAILAGRRKYWPLVGPIVVLALGCATLTSPRKTTPAAHVTNENDQAVITRVYDVRDVLIDIPDFDNPATLDVHSLPSAPSPEKIRANPTKSATSQATLSTQPSPSRQQLVNDLITHITSTIDPYTWQVNTGLVGTIEEANGRLTITQSRATHHRIWNYLQEQRGKHSVQVCVEARFLQSETIEKSLEATGQRWSNVGSPSFEFWPRFLDDAEVKRLIALANSDTQSTTLTAPRLTLFDGQRAYVTVARSTAFVESMKPKGDGKFEPVIAVADSGILLDCQPRVSPDHKNVTLALRPKCTSLLDLTVERWPGSPPGRDDLKVQVPHLKVTSLDATITMPDRQYALYRLRPRYQPATPATQPVRTDETTLLLVSPKVIVTQPGKIEGVDDLDN